MPQHFLQSLLLASSCLFVPFTPNLLLYFNIKFVLGLNKNTESIQCFLITYFVWKDKDTWSCIGIQAPIPCFVTFLTTDRKSTRLNSSHVSISYAVFCLKKKKKSSNNISC